MQFEQGFLRLSLGETMSTHDWRDGIGHFCIADYLAELDDVHLCKALYISPGFTVVICLKPFGRAGYNRFQVRGSAACDLRRLRRTRTRRVEPFGRLMRLGIV
jgi:hypothetical protein